DAGLPQGHSHTSPKDRDYNWNSPVPGQVMRPRGRRLLLPDDEHPTLVESNVRVSFGQPTLSPVRDTVPFADPAGEFTEPWPTLASPLVAVIPEPPPLSFVHDAQDEFQVPRVGLPNQCGREDRVI